MTKLVKAEKIGIKVDDDLLPYIEVRVLVNAEDLVDIKRKHSPIYIDGLKSVIGDAVLKAIGKSDETKI